MKKAKKILNIVLNVIIAIIFIIMLFVAYSFAQVNIFHKDFANIFGYTMFQVKTGSMEPALQTGDVVIEKILKKDDSIKENDIISYKTEDYIVTHRIIEIGEDFVITQGDANNAKDEPIKKDSIIGKVIKVIPDVSIWINVFQTKQVYVMIFITIVLFIFTFSINTDDDKKAKEKMENKDDEKEK